MTAPPLQLDRLRLDDFIDNYWAPETGQSTCLVGPNGCGKTTIGIRLLGSSAVQHPRIRRVVLVMKPHKGPKSQGRRATGDRTVANLTRRFGGRIIRDWPPPPLLWRHEPPFWVLWPTHTGEPEEDDARHHEIFRRCLIDCYKKGDAEVFCDEAAGLTDDLDLEAPIKQILQRGRSLDVDGMLATQRPRNVPRAMFTEAKHFFLWRMNDAAEYERIREIGGGRLTRQQITSTLTRLGKHDCLYLYPDQNVAVILV